MPEAGDLDEDAAAERLAAALRVTNVDARPAATGRVNLHALSAGVFTVDKALIDAINAVDPAITLATLADHATVEAGRMVATVKIIPFAVAGALVARAASLAAGRDAFAVHPFAPRRVGLVQTMLPNVKGQVLDKTARITEARLARSGSRTVRELRTPHDAAPVAAAIRELLPDSDMIVLFGASAMCDPQDVVPAAIRAAGGTVSRAGMPVDPGNLLVLGEVGGKPVIGAPGCARSPKENGFDWVLDRLMAGLDVSAEEITGMGVGGLLMEIATRPQPREAARRKGAPKVAAVLLAAGRSSRMGANNKLLARFDGVPLVRRTARETLASGAAPVVAVVGHQAGAVRAALEGLDLAVTENPDFASGLAGSLKTGTRRLPPDVDAALIVLADMPELSSADLTRMIDAFVRRGGGVIVRATHDGKRGNPVLLPRALFSEIERLTGDTGARHIVEASELETVEVEIGRAAGIDVDTPDALRLAGGEFAE